MNKPLKFDIRLCHCVLAPLNFALKHCFKRGGRTHNYNTHTQCCVWQYRISISIHHNLVSLWKSFVIRKFIRLTPRSTMTSSAGQSKKRVCYYYDGDIGNYYYGQGHPMKPHRIRMAHNLILNYGLYRKMEIYVCL